MSKIDTKCSSFAHLLNNELIHADSEWQRNELVLEIIQIKNDKHQLISLNLTPFKAIKSNDTVEDYFSNVSSIDALIDVYNQLKQDFKFESSIRELSVSNYANKFLDAIFIAARSELMSDDVMLIVDFVKNLDCYTAVKSIESLLYSHSDLALLRIAMSQNWAVHFDHIAIRCGSSENDSARKVAKLLIEEHGYSHPQIKTEKFYLFTEGWSAYPLYKILANGQVLRIFVDQSEINHPQQIIQHWNDIYGFTAHHLALRLTEITDGNRSAVPLQDIIKLMMKQERDVLTPAGYYTKGLLSQVFTKPEKNLKIPDTLLKDKKLISNSLPDILVNAKLLEIVSRKEMSSALAKKYFEFYDIDYNVKAPLHSAVYYQYFLPAQAAHVIKSSVEI